MPDSDNCGPSYGMSLIDSLPIGTGTMKQAMPSAADLSNVLRGVRCGSRVVGGFEVLSSHFMQARQLITDLIKTESSTSDEFAGEAELFARARQFIESTNQPTR